MATTSTAPILLLSRSPGNLSLLAECLGKEGYQVLTAASLDEWDRLCADRPGLGLALVDVAGFDQRLWLRCERLRQEQVPFFILSHRQSTALQQESLARGARGVLVKPLAVKALLGIVHDLLEGQG